MTIIRQKADESHGTCRAWIAASRHCRYLAQLDASGNSMLREREPAQGTLVPRIIHGTQRSLDEKIHGQKRRQLGANIFRSLMSAAATPHHCNVNLRPHFFHTA
jgi:hypothetical protein